MWCDAECSSYIETPSDPHCGVHSRCVCYAKPESNESYEG